MTPIYENYRSETPAYVHYATRSKKYEISLFGLKLSKNYKISLFGLKLLATTVNMLQRKYVNTVYQVKNKKYMRKQAHQTKN